MGPLCQHLKGHIRFKLTALDFIAVPAALKGNLVCSFWNDLA
jgi:hypothetical protein